MERLEKLLQSNRGTIYSQNGDGSTKHYAINQQAFPRGRVQTLVVEHPCLDIRGVINEMSDRNSARIPQHANAYVTSEFNGDTQHIRIDENGSGKETMHSVYAIQFYLVPSLPHR